MRYAHAPLAVGSLCARLNAWLHDAAAGKAATEVHLDPNIREAVEELQRHLGTKVLLRQKTKSRPGQLVLEYYDDAQLMGIYDRLMK